MLNLLSSLTQFSGRAGQALGVLPQHPCLWPSQSIPGGIRSSARLVRRSLPQVRTTLHPTCGFKGWGASCDIHGCQPVSVTPPSPRHNHCASLSKLRVSCVGFHDVDGRKALFCPSFLYRSGLC